MFKYLRARWKVDNLIKFERQLFVQRRFTLDEYIEGNYFLYKTENLRKTGEQTNQLLKLKVYGKSCFVINKVFNKLPTGFEAYEMAVSGKLDLKDALSFLRSIGYKEVEKYDKKVTVYSFKNEKFSTVMVEEMKWGKYLKVVDEKEVIERIGIKMGFKMRDVTHDDYRDMYRKYLFANGLKEGTKLLYK